MITIGALIASFDNINHVAGLFPGIIISIFHNLTTALSIHFKGFISSNFNIGPI
jgi:hypothetical protein